MGGADLMGEVPHGGGGDSFESKKSQRLPVCSLFLILLFEGVSSPLLALAAVPAACCHVSRAMTDSHPSETQINSSLCCLGSGVLAQQ